MPRRQKMRCLVNCYICGKQIERIKTRIVKTVSCCCSRACHAALKTHRKGSTANAWKGGKIKRGDYWYVKKPQCPGCSKQGYIAEHRLIMEHYLGRPLDPKEVVHHIDHNPANNHISNLRLYNNAGMHASAEHVRCNKNTGNFESRPVKGVSYIQG